MEHRPPGSLLGWIFLPMVAVLALGLAPQPNLAQENFKLANEAVLDHHPALESKALNAILEIFPERVDLWELAGTAALEAGQSQQALIDFKQAIGSGPLKLSSTIALGDAYLLNGDQEHALETWTRLLVLYGPNGDVYDRLVRVYISQLNYSDALRVLGDWSSWQPDNPKVLYQMGLLLVTHQPQDALPILLRAEQLDSSLSPSVKKIQERINAANGSTEPGVELFQAGRALGELGEWRLASEAFNQAVKISPDFAEAWAFLGEAKQQIGDDGQTYLDHALSLNANSVLVMALEAIYLERRGKPASALIYLHAIADREPKNGVWQVELGHALVQMGDLQTAFVYYQNAVRVEPDNSAMWRSLASYCLVYNTQLDSQGLAAARKAVALAPEDPVGLDLLGQILVELGDYYSADRFFWRAIQSNPDYAPVYLHRGVMYLDEGDRERAYQSLRRVLDLAAVKPEGQQAQRLLDKFFFTAQP